MQGKLLDGKEIEVKRIWMRSRQGIEEIKNEVMLIVKLRHRNLVRLLGCCLEGGENLLVFQYLVNCNLDAFLFGSVSYLYLSICLAIMFSMNHYSLHIKKISDFTKADPVERRELDRTKRVQIIKGIARGLLYLHEDSRLKTIHRDLKASMFYWTTR